jgi:hypothetical protein
MIFIAKIIVGSAGHNSDYNCSDYLASAFIVITVTTMTILSFMDDQKSQIKNGLRYAAVTFVSISIVFEIYGLYEMLRDTEFTAGENVLTASIFLFSIISSIVLWGLMKDKK